MRRLMGAATGTLVLLTCLLVACASVPEPGARDETARLLADGEGLEPLVLHAASSLPIQGYGRTPARHAPVAIYIEGDGYAWVTRTTPSQDPTPVNPVALKLAVLDSSANVVYLARPGQYLHGTVDRRYWLGARFAPEVIDTYVAVLKELAASLDATEIDVTGYSGGGAVAALAVARLSRESPTLPIRLRTVGGNLDTAAWARARRITPLEGSLNPADDASTLRDVPQIHVIGSRDREVPPAVFSSYAARLGSSRCVQEVQVDATHAGPWDNAWRKVLAMQPTCLRNP